MASGFNASVLFMVVSVFAIMGLVAFQIVRAVRQAEEREIAAESGAA